MSDEEQDVGKTPPDDEEQGTSTPASKGGRPLTRDVPVIPERSPDDSDVGWSREDSERDDDERFLRDRPPHWQG